MNFREEFRFLKEKQSLGQKTVLVTVCAVEGSSMRNPGSIMGVAQDGSFAGSLSGGCIENAVVAEALDVLACDAARIVRFGAGSPYLDIKLPCGGGLDLHFQPLGSSDLAATCLQSIDNRMPFSIAIGDAGAEFRGEWRAAHFDIESRLGVFGHWPSPRLSILGHGAGVEALANLARTMGIGSSVLTPDSNIVAALEASGTSAQLLARTTQIDLLQADPWTAIVFLFHDHDWEIDLMTRAIGLPHFYLGAMGGRQAHAMRCAALNQNGIGEDQIETIRAPIGVFHSSRDPQTLALSTLAEIVRTYQETDFEAERG